MRLTRRSLVRDLTLLTAGLAVGCRSRGLAAIPAPSSDPEGLLDLPPGFRYSAISRAGEVMDDGLRVPAGHDGMAAFAGPRGTVILVRNHELGLGSADAAGFDPRALDRREVYDAGAYGGTTTVVYDPESRRVVRQYQSLAGTVRNCAGGPTPWGSWISCEESVEMAADGSGRPHGYCFEVPARAMGRVPPRPLHALGRFNHEAVAVEPSSGCVYLTEDRPDGLLYRFVPAEPGVLARGGRLQALKLRDTRSADTRNWKSADAIVPGQRLDAEWVDLRGVEPVEDDLRLRGAEEYGAARFARGEGIWRGRSGIYFTCTNGGPQRSGQVWRYQPSVAEGTPDEQAQPGRLELFSQPEQGSGLRSPDNLVVSHRGELFVCEDGRSRADQLVGIDRSGRTQVFARNALNDSELAGSCFSPDGRVLFVNMQTPGVTFAIHGDF